MRPSAPSSPGSIVFHIASCPPYGMGAVAKKTIAKGELILLEQPLVVQEEDRSVQSILGSLCRQPTSHTQAYLNLHNAFGESLDPILGIFNSNCIPLAPIDPVPNASSILEYGVFLQLSKFNNSCIPNASVTWHQRTREMTVHAVQTIPAGHEILISYGQHLFSSRAERRAFLQRTYGFRCTCACCSMSVDASRASDARRTELTRLFKAVPFLGHDPPAGIRAVSAKFTPLVSLNEALILPKAAQALQALQYEGLNLYQDVFSWDAYQFCMAIGDTQLAQEWLTRAYQSKVISSGRESDAAQFFAQTMLHLPR